MKSRMHAVSIATAIFATAVLLSAQTTVYVQNGTSGIGSNTNSSSNVGIGTATPTSKLSVEGGVLSYDVRFKDTDGYVTFNLNSTDSGGGTGGALKFRTGDATERVRFAANGNVGIGTAAPGSPLEIRFAATNEGLALRGNDGAHVVATVTQRQQSGVRSGILNLFDGTTQTVKIESSVAAGAPTFFNAGNVGIGTTSPGSKFTVKATDGGTGGIRLQHSNDSGPAVNIHQTSGDGAIDLYTGESPTTLRSHISAYGHTYFNPAGGNVGIGTSSPGGRLHIYSGSSGGVPHANADELVLENSAHAGMAILAGASSEASIFFGDSGAPYMGQIVYVNSGDYMRFTTANAESMRLLSNGNVGIGTTSPSHKLAVNGTVRAKEVIVDTGWSDYVFADDYRLTPLSEVEKHIKAKKHLPDIPSTAEVEQGGVSLGEMQAKLLAKIEELTLHLIAQEKRNDAQQAEIVALRTEVVRLSKTP